MKYIFKDIINWYFSRRTLPYWCVLALDCAILICSSIIAFWAFNRGAELQRHFWSLSRSVIVFLAVNIVFFRVFRTYSGIIRYSSFVDMIRIVESMFCSVLVIIPLNFFLSNNFNGFFGEIQTRHIIACAVISTMLMWMMRIAIKNIYDIYFLTGNAKNVFIYGIRAGGVGLAKMLIEERPSRYKVKGFISHDSSLVHEATLMGKPIFEVNGQLTEELKNRSIFAVLVAPGRIARFREDSVLQDYILNAGVKIFVSNMTEEFDKEDLTDPKLNEVSIEDLLPRDEIKVDLESVSQVLSGRRVLVTGSAGSIGSEIVRQVASFKPESMVLIDSAETPQHEIRMMLKKSFPELRTRTVVTSIVNADRMESIFKSFKPEYVFHAAAYKHVPMMEDNPSESIQNNVAGTKILADLSVKYGVRKFVMISTDKAVNPTNVMGCSKRICEIYVQSLNQAEKAGKVEGSTQFVTTRFGNVLGSNGSVIPIFRKQIEEGGPVTVTDPRIIRYFMLIPEACKLVLEAGAKGEGGEIFVFDMGKPVLIADLARKMIELSGATNVRIVFTGLRDGEKLYEEVLSEKEGTKPSFHEKIRIASVRDYSFDEVERKINDLIELSHEYDDMRTVAAMKELVPEFVSNHSRYSSLDTDN